MGARRAADGPDAARAGARLRAGSLQVPRSAALRERYLRREFPKLEYSVRVDALRRQYPVLALARARLARTLAGVTAERRTRFRRGREGRRGSVVDSSAPWRPRRLKTEGVGNSAEFPWEADRTGAALPDLRHSGVD